MQMEGQGLAGLPNFADGSTGPVSLGRQRELLVNELNGRYVELARRGALFHSMTGSVGVASALVSPLAAATGQPILGLWNPPGSQKNLIILKVGVITVSGTPGGPILWNFGINQNITATPNVTPLPGLLAGAGTSVAKGFSVTALTGFTPAATALKHAANISAVAAAFVDGAALEDLSGDIIVPPGGFLGLAAFAVGTSHVVQASITHAELPA